MRKDSGFEVMDHIDLYVSGNDRIAQIIKRNEAQIKDEVLGEAVHYEETSNAAREWTLNGEKVKLGVVKR